MNLTNESKTLFLCLKAKSDMSKQNFLIHDEYAEKICDQINIDFKQSKYLSMFLTLRAYLIDEAIKPYLNQESIVLHYGCGLDMRYKRLNANIKCWYDIDFEAVLDLKKTFIQEDDHYQMIACDQNDFIASLQASTQAILILEGVSMYMDEEQLKALLKQVALKYPNVFIIMDTYSKLAVKLSKYKNPINQMNAKVTYGIDHQDDLIKLHEHLKFIKKYPIKTKTNHWIFDHLYCGKTASKMMQIYEFKLEE